MIRYFASHPTAANLLMVIFIAIGIVALPQLRRETFPDFASDQVKVSVIYPGATAEDIENSVCQLIEDAVEEVVEELAEVQAELEEVEGELAEAEGEIEELQEVVEEELQEVVEDETAGEVPAE